MNRLRIGLVAAGATAVVLLLAVASALDPAASRRGAAAAARPGPAPGRTAEDGGRHVWEPLPREAPAPPGNPTTPEKVALGERLFFDRNLSLDRRVACASCHAPVARAGADARPVSVGVGGRLGHRNAPTVWNAAFQSRLFWDGRAPSLEEQAKGPFVNPREMAMPSLAGVVDRVREQPRYRREFHRAFGSETFGIEEIAAAIAAYERTLITPETPYDRFVRGDPLALNARQLRGMALFEAVGCVQCHGGPNFSAASFATPGGPFRAFPVFDAAEVEPLRLRQDRGRAGPESQRGVWRVPSLRNVALTAPYFHNGSVARLDQAVRIMARAQLGLTVGTTDAPAPVVARSDAGRVRLILPQQLSDRDVLDITAFLEALSDESLARGAMKTTRRNPDWERHRSGAAR